MRLLPVLAVLATLAAQPIPAAAGPMTEGERQRLLAHFEMTEAWLASELAGLSDAQLAFRMAPDSWSVRDVVEHLAIAEPQSWKQLEDSMARPLPASAYTPQATDAGILWYGIDRGNRQRTGEARVPDGRFKTAAEAHAAFVKLRATMTARAKTQRRRLPRPSADRRQHGRLSVVPDDLHALAAPHPADPRGQGAPAVSEALTVDQRRLHFPEPREAM